MTDTRKYWVQSLIKIAKPVLYALSQGKLREQMPIEHHKDSLDRQSCTYLEALGRTIMGISPWLGAKCADEWEEKQREEMCKLSQKAIANAVNPTSPDVMNFEQGYQAIVDAAFLAQGILRCPDKLFFELDDVTKRNLIIKMKSTRTRKPFPNNWLLFSAIIEVFLYVAGESDWDQMRIDYAVRQHMQWYKGDGVYGDGEQFHFDYYNSFVIQPMLCDILLHVGKVNPDWEKFTPVVMKRASHFAAILEHLIAPDGSYPIIGRSSCYRFGAFQSLSQAVLLSNLPEEITPSQVRCGLTAVMKRIMSFTDMFDENGYLTIGVCGRQPSMGETYISTGSLYLCTAVFLPLGLDEKNEFWEDIDKYWTSKQLWNGQDRLCEHTI